MSKILLGACGDISFTGKLENNVRQKGSAFAFENITDSFRKADVLFGNLESVLIPESFPREKACRLPMCCIDHVAGCLKTAGFDILNLANNHILDCGWRGLLHTYNVVSAMGIKPLGAGRSRQEARKLQIIETRGARIGFLGYQEPCNCTYEGGGGRVSYYELSQAMEDIKESRPQVDTLIVSFHGEMEFNPAPSLLKVKHCRKLAECGADIILCHHPHVPQGIERWGSSLIAYSLGNFAFELDRYQMNGYPHTKRSHLLFIEIDNGRVSNWYREYFKIDEAEARPYKLNDEEYREAEDYYRYLDSLVSDPDKLRKAWHEASMRYLKIYLDAVTEQGLEEFIRHYGFKIFSLGENRHWVEGIWELIKLQYANNVYNDFEYTRPNSPFETPVKRQ